MTMAGVKSYLYYFTYVDSGKRARLGAHHGEELFFLSDSFPSDWDHSDKDEYLGKLLRGYWVEFVKTGDPNFDRARHWPPYNGKSAEYFEVGEHVGLRPVSERIRTLETIMQQIVAQEKRD
jgi:para-nitrobenzyl esterase